MVNLVDRRAFLTHILGASVALAVMPRMDALAALHPGVNPDEITGPVWEAIYTEVMEEAWAGFVSQAGAFKRLRGIPTEPFTERDGLKFTPLGVMIGRPQSGQPGEYFTARAAGAYLGALCQERGWNAYAPPIHPRRVEHVGTAHEVLRYVKCWDAMSSDIIHRIDVYGAKA